MVQFLSINFFSWISSIFVGFFKSSRFFLCHSVYGVQLCGQNFTSCVVSFYVNSSDVTDYKECVLFLDKHTVSY